MTIFAPIYPIITSKTYPGIPTGLTVEQADDLRKTNPAEYDRRSVASMVEHIKAMLDFQQRGAEVFDYGNNLRQRAFEGGVESYNFV